MNNLISLFNKDNAHIEILVEDKYHIEDLKTKHYNVLLIDDDTEEIIKEAFVNDFSEENIKFIIEHFGKTINEELTIDTKMNELLKLFNNYYTHISVDYTSIQSKNQPNGYWVTLVDNSTDNWIESIGIKDFTDENYELIKESLSNKLKELQNGK